MSSLSISTNLRFLTSISTLRDFRRDKSTRMEVVLRREPAGDANWGCFKELVWRISKKKKKMGKISLLKDLGDVKCSVI